MDTQSHFPYGFIDRVIISEADIKTRVKELGEIITRDYQNSEQLLLLGLLRGSVVFITDLMREIRRPITMDFMSISSYNKSESSGFVRIDSDHKTNIRGWDVILIDDIVDSGYTIRTVRKLLLDREPAASRCAPCSINPNAIKWISTLTTWASVFLIILLSATAWTMTRRAAICPILPQSIFQKARVSRCRWIS